MKSVQPVYDVIKETLKRGDVLIIKSGKNQAKVQDVYKSAQGTYVYSSLGKQKVDLFTELYIE